MTSLTCTIPKEINNDRRTKYFPNILFDMLQQLEIDNAANIASWHPDGTAFCVHKHKKFVETVLPKYVTYMYLPLFAMC